MLKKAAAGKPAPRKATPRKATPKKALSKTKATKRPKTAPTANEADPRFLPVVEAFAGTPGFSLMESKSQAMRGLVLNGKSFGMSSHGRLILKLDEGRSAMLIADGTGEPFRPAPGRVMKSWVEVTNPKADWVALAREAHRLAKAGSKKS